MKRLQAILQGVNIREALEKEQDWAVLITLYYDTDKLEEPPKDLVTGFDRISEADGYDDDSDMNFCVWAMTYDGTWKELMQEVQNSYERISKKAYKWGGDGSWLTATLHNISIDQNQDVPRRGSGFYVTLAHVGQHRVNNALLRKWGVI